MNNKKQADDTQAKLITGLSAGLLLSVVANIALAVMAFGGGEEVGDTFEGGSAESPSFYEERVVELEGQNERLTAKVEQLERAADSGGEDDPSDPTPSEGDTETSQEDMVRTETYRVANNFLDRFLNVNTATMTLEERRAVLSDYAATEILAQIAPTPEEMVEMGLFPHEGDYDPNVEGAENVITYEQSIDSKQVFIDEDSLSTDTVEILADVVSQVEDSTDISYELDERYSIQISQVDGRWVVVDYSIERLGM